MKKGVSNVVAVVLLVGLVVAAVAILWNVLMPQIQSDADEATSEIPRLEIGLEDGYTYWEPDNKSDPNNFSGHIYVQIIRGAENSATDCLQFIFWNGNETEFKEECDVLSPNSKKIYRFWLPWKPTLIRVAPYVRGELKDFVFEIDDPKDIKDVVEGYKPNCPDIVEFCAIEECWNPDDCCFGLEDRDGDGWYDICNRDDLEGITDFGLEKNYIIQTDIDASDDELVRGHIVSVASLGGGISSAHTIHETTSADLSGEEAVKYANHLLVDYVLNSDNLWLGLVGNHKDYIDDFSHDLSNKTSELHTHIDTSGGTGWTNQGTPDLCRGLSKANETLQKEEAPFEAMIIMAGQRPNSCNVPGFSFTESGPVDRTLEYACHLSTTHGYAINTIGILGTAGGLPSPDVELEKLLINISQCSEGTFRAQYAWDTTDLTDVYKASFDDFKLFADPFTPIGYSIVSPEDQELTTYQPFTGQLNGNGNRIHNLTLNYAGDDNIGLFAYLKEANVFDVKLEITSASGDDNIGSLAGSAENTTISKVYTARDSRVYGINNVGSLVGWAKEVELSEAYSSVDVDGRTNVGGLIGYAEDTEITDSYFNSDSTLNGDLNVGGLIGEGVNILIEDSYAAGDIMGGNKTGGIVGLVSGISSINGVFSIIDVLALTDDGWFGGLVGEIGPDVTLDNSHWLNYSTDNATICVGSDPDVDCNVETDLDYAEYSSSFSPRNIWTNWALPNPSNPAYYPYPELKWNGHVY